MTSKKKAKKGGVSTVMCPLTGMFECPIGRYLHAVEQLPKSVRHAANPPTTKKKNQGKVSKL